MSRGGFKINRNSDEYASSERVSWIDQFADNIHKASKTAVEVARERSEVSLHDQISSVMSNKPAHSSVESLVKELQDRTGLSEYLKRAAANPEGRKITADMDYDSIFAKVKQSVKEDIINYCKNTIATHRGQITVPAIQYDILAQFKGEGIQPQDVDEDSVARCISQLISEELMKHPPADLRSEQLGSGVGVLDVEENDEDNSDIFSGLMPANNGG